MKYLALLVLIHLALLANGQVFVQPPNNEAFLQNEVAEVRIIIAPNDLTTILGDSLYSDHHFPATFYYNSPSFSDTIALVGFRVRGNTSRDANKKSFKVSFNEYETGQKFKGIEKMNLIGQHNDPSELRYWLSLKTLSDNGLICSRVSFVKLFINGDYRGLYLNVEHIDDEFLQKRFVNDDGGNLYKCFWGSDLTYSGNNPAAYSSTYELKTNELQNDYSGLIQFLDDLNNMSDAEFPCFIEENFEVDLYLKTLAAEVLIGHWDGHSYNKNNFYLYQKPSDGKFVFIEYDMDNTFGIDWFGINWSTRSINNWQNSNRPLTDRLLSYPYYRDQFNQDLDELLNYFDDPNTLLALQQKQNEVDASVQTDAYYTMDYGFQYADFSDALNNGYGAHVTQGITEYLSSRVSTGFNQVTIVGNQNEPCPDASIEELSNLSKELVMIVDFMGRKTEFKPNTPLIYVCSDGSRECVMRIKQ
ncbi:MAG: CotH kinase family protein [Crocinitomicaceae bacterium]